MPVIQRKTKNGIQLFQKIYAYKKNDGTCGCLEAVSSKDARKWLGSKVKVKTRVITMGLWQESHWDEAMRAAIFAGAANIDEARAWIKQHGLKAVE